MKQCKNCISYDAEMEALRQSGDDVIIVGHENDEEKNYCFTYPEGIPLEIAKDRCACELKISKENFKNNNA